MGMLISIIGLSHTGRSFSSEIQLWINRHYSVDNPVNCSGVLHTDIAFNTHRLIELSHTEGRVFHTRKRGVSHTLCRLITH